MAIHYPYLIVRLAPAVYRTHYPPEDLSREALIAYTRAMMQEHDNRFRMCVVFGREDAVYLEPDGSQKESREAPSGLTFIPHGRPN